MVTSNTTVVETQAQSVDIGDPYYKNCGGDHKAAECELLHLAKACNLCQQLGHDNRDCYNQIPCTLCNSGGHSAKTCFKVARKLSVAEKLGIKPETTCKSLLGEMGECKNNVEMNLVTSPTLAQRLPYWMKI
jgi:hypothetical protein